MTGPEFAAAHGNDSSTWTTADIETEINLAMADIQPAYLLTHPPKPTTDHDLAA
ncbi:hypothetical protein ACL07V_37475 [Streptomyces sp. MB22_4]|uniref:hypothetical protein n=1 Tax=Streptomyces sp. MB22_4 TaxID=3383120 RepID=UPI0039A08B02